MVRGGDPGQRDRERVLADVLDGFVTVEAAARAYGVVITAAMEIDRAATTRARSEG